MSVKELKNQTLAELRKTVNRERESLRVMNFKVAQRQLKKVHAIKKTKRTIARTLTLANQLQRQPSKSN